MMIDMVEINFLNFLSLFLAQFPPDESLALIEAMHSAEAESAISPQFQLMNNSIHIWRRNSAASSLFCLLPRTKC